MKTPILTLAINTASTQEALALLAGKKLIAETTWGGKSDESEKLLPHISVLLKKTHHSFEDIERIIVVKGPGPFSAVRIGVTVANVLAMTLRTRLYAIDTKKLWLARAPAKSAILLLHAGGDFVAQFFGGSRGKILHIREAFDLKKEHLVFFGDITENEMETFKKLKRKSWKFIPENKLKSFADAVSGVNFSLLKREKIVSPLYWRPPNITKEPLKNYV